VIERLKDLANGRLGNWAEASFRHRKHTLSRILSNARLYRGCAAFALSGATLALAAGHRVAARSSSLRLHGRVVAVVAGGGPVGPRFAGNKGRAVGATLVEPRALALDGQGDIFIADNLGASPSSRACQVEEVNSRTKRIRVLVHTGLGLRGCGGIVVRSRTTLIVSDDGRGRVVAIGVRDKRSRVLAGGGRAGRLGDGERGRVATLYGPSGLAVGKRGEILIADTDHNRIRRIDSHGIITTVAGDGIAGFKGDGSKATRAELRLPLGVSFDKDGNIYIADEGNNRIREVIARSGTIVTVAGGGACRQAYCGEGGSPALAKISSPQAVAVDSKGDVFIAASARVLEIPSGARIVRTIAGDGTLPLTLTDARHQLLMLPAAKAELDPVGLAVNEAGTVLVVDAATRTIREVRQR